QAKPGGKVGSLDRNIITVDLEDRRGWVHHDAFPRHAIARGLAFIWPVPALARARPRDDGEAGIRVMRGRLSMAVGRSTFGAERRHVTLPTDFHSRSENGHSRYGHLTARFAPQRPFAVGRAGRIREVGDYARAAHCRK